MSDVDTTREQINKIIDGALAQIRPVIKPEGGTGIMGTLSASDFLRIDIHDLLEQTREQARNAALDDLLEAMPKEHIGWKQMPTKQQIGVSDGYNKALADVTATIHQLKSSKKGADDE